MLSVDGLDLHFGKAQILKDLSLDLFPGEVAVLLGRNGAGKTSTLRAVMGLVPCKARHIRYRDISLSGLAPNEIARAGLGYVPEDRRIFADLTVSENLETGRLAPRCPGREAWTPEKLFEMFPNLAEMRNRRADRMSGGEQQMLSVARTLMGNPEVLLLDEPSEGLAPIIVSQMADTVLRLKQQGVSVLLSEQNFNFSRKVGDRAYVIEKGSVVHQGSMEELDRDSEIRDRYLAVSR